MAGGRQGLAIQQGALFAQAQAALGEPAHGQRVDPVFFLVNPSGQAFRRILRLYRDYCLYDQWPPIEFLRHEVHAATVLAVAGFEGALMGMQPLRRGSNEGWIFSRRPW